MVVMPHLQLWEKVGSPGELAATGLHVEASCQLKKLW